MALSAADQAALMASTNVHKFDLTITNTIEEDVTIELFNNAYSVTKVYNPKCDPNWFPISVSLVPVIVANANVTNGYANCYFMGGVDTYTNAEAATPTGSTQSYVFFDVSGRLVYQPGYLNGSQTSGLLTVQSKQTNYNHVFNTLGQSSMFLRQIKATMVSGSSYVGTQLNEDFNFVSQNITKSTAGNATNASTYQNEYVYQANIVTCPINQLINPNSGLQYTVKAYDGTTVNTIQLSFQFIPSSGMLS